jgi:hypothetical protein
MVQVNINMIWDDFTVITIYNWHLSGGVTSKSKLLLYSAYISSFYFTHLSQDGCFAFSK